jgi:U3 small nucleolar RNA-associated protein 7
MPKDKRVQAKLRDKKVLDKEIQKRLKEREVLLPEQEGFLQPDEGERTIKLKQDDLKELLPIDNVNNIFDLDLDHGPYAIDYTRNGKYLLMGGRKGHISMLDWKEKSLVCEFSLDEKVRDVQFLQDNKLFAVAQKKYTYIYDSTGMEIHCLKHHIEPKYLKFMPYHLLLVTATMRGHLKYQDVTTGEIISEMKSKKGEPFSLCQNKHNGIMHMGHSYGGVSLWSPNMGTSLVDILCHPSAPVTSISIKNDGRYMVTTGTDSRMKVWDLRKYQVVHDYFTLGPAFCSDISQKNLLSVGFGNNVQVWKDWDMEKQKEPYMSHRVKKGSTVKSCKFSPFEDFLGIGHQAGFSSIVVPGAGEANYTFESMAPRREALVHEILEKLQPSTITLDQSKIGTIDRASKEIKKQESKEEMDEWLAKQKPKAKKRGTKGRQKIGKCLIILFI